MSHLCVEYSVCLVFWHTSTHKSQITTYHLSSWRMQNGSKSKMDVHMQYKDCWLTTVVQWCRVWRWEIETQNKWMCIIT